MIATLVTRKCVAGFTVFLTYFTSVALIGGEVAGLHVQLHGTEIVPRASTEVAGVSVGGLATVLSTELL